MAFGFIEIKSVWHEMRLQRVFRKIQQPALEEPRGFLTLFWKCFVHFVQVNRQSTGRAKKNRKNKTLCFCRKNHYLMKAIHRQHFSLANQNISGNWKAQCPFWAVLKDFPKSILSPAVGCVYNFTVYSGMRFHPYRLLNVPGWDGLPGWGLFTLCLDYLFLFLTIFREKLQCC